MEITADTLSRREWDRFTHDGPMQQAWAYGAACAALGSRVMRFEARQNGQLIGVAQAVHRRLLGCLHAVVCTRGPVWAEGLAPAQQAEALAGLRRALPLPWLRGLFVTPDCPDAAPVLESAGMARVMTPYATAVIDLTRPDDDLRAAMHQKWRNRLVAAERAGLRVGRLDRRPERYAWLLDEEVMQQRSRRYAALPPALVSAWHHEGGALRVLTAMRGDETLAAMIFLIHGARATYHLGWTSREGKRLSAHNLILWRALGKLRAAGVHTLDLGGLNTHDIPGIARFKLGTGARPRILSGTWFGR